MQAPQATAQQRDFRERLVAEGLLVPSAVPGVTGQGPVFVDLRQRLDARLTALFADEGAVAMEFPPVEPPSEDVRRQAVARRGVLTKPAGSLGKLEELGVWVSACQGVCPPRPFTRPRVVVFAGDQLLAIR